MKPHQTMMAASVARRIDSGTVATVPNGTQTAFNSGRRSPPASSEARYAPSRVKGRPHTLVLSGALDGGSARTLEAEIERLCDEGVTGITLDLRELTYIDSIGVAVIAFRCGLCQRRGYDFALIPGSRFVRRAFEQAGVTELLPFKQASSLAVKDNVAAQNSVAAA
jgi:anti-anti-sigma factor